MLGFSAVAQFSITEYGVAARGKSDFVFLQLHGRHDENIELAALHAEIIPLHARHDENIALDAKHHETIDLHARHQETKELDA
jgi:hypothetical protein